MILVYPIRSIILLAFILIPSFALASKAPEEINYQEARKAYYALFSSPSG